MATNTAVTAATNTSTATMAALTVFLLRKGACFQRRENNQFTINQSKTPNFDMYFLKFIYIYHFCFRKGVLGFQDSISSEKKMLSFEFAATMLH